MIINQKVVAIKTKFPYRELLLLIALALSFNIVAQDISFFHISKIDGLSDHAVNSLVTDHNGMVWIGTENGLNSYDGYTLRNFFAHEYSGLQNNKILRLVCDKKNRIWIQCDRGLLTLLNENRQFIAVNAPGQIKADYLLPVNEQPMFISKGRIYTVQGNGKGGFNFLLLEDEPLLNRPFERVNLWDENTLVFSGNNQLILYDLTRLEITATVEVPGIVATTKLKQGVAVATSGESGKLYEVEISSGSILKSYRGLKDQFGETMHGSPGSIKRLDDEKFLISSSTAGIYIWDYGNGSLVRHQHDIFDHRSLAAHNTSYIFNGSNGYYFISVAGRGVSYFKYGANLANVKYVFQDKSSGTIYDGSIGFITGDAQGNYWMAASNTLIKWNPTAGESRQYAIGAIRASKRIGSIKALHIDENENIWVGATSGIFVLDSNWEVVKSFDEESGLPGNYVSSITRATDGQLWVGTSGGICMIDPETKKIRLPEAGSPLSIVQGKFCNTIWFKSDNDIWIGTKEGAINVNLDSGSVTTYSTENGLAFDEIIGFEGDEEGRTYIATRYGFHILDEKKQIEAYTEINEIWKIDCHSLTRDRFGNIWFANKDFLAVYSPENKQFEVYDEKAGVNEYGFQFFSAFSNPSGELLFGSNKGLTFFTPENLEEPGLPVSVMARQLHALNQSYNLEYAPEIELPFTSQPVTFSFSAVNLSRGKNMFFQYRLSPVEENWVYSSSQRATYHKLQPGTYTFDVKASTDGLNWVNSPRPVTFSILKPWWRQNWFIFSCISFVLSGCLLFILRRNKEERYQQEQLEIERAINYLASSLHEHNSEDAILWDIVKNCIGHLKFEDCVIYLLDEKRQILLQKAAWGPKTTDDNTIANPIEIPMGQGIVGSVAASGKAEIVSDTSLDKRYIVDDAVRLSEITVPIVYNNNVLGVIDSEHSDKGFFTRKHLFILTAVAAVCANKIVRMKALNEKQRAQLELLRHEREIAEEKLKSLRLQMNPHFLFNSLNSIQQMILSGNGQAATIYLSKFSRLLRLVLAHCDREKLTLKEELDTLKLYVELESLRFNDSFQYSFNIDEKIDTEEIKIPTMLIQPFVENAIWHGLMHKEGSRKLHIAFTEDIEENLICTIEDNGIGRKAAGSARKREHNGKGNATAEERLKTYNGHHGTNSKIIIEDITDTHSKVCGTRVILVLPLI